MPPSPSVTVYPGAGEFAAEVSRQSRTNLNLCFQCASCANGCPFVAVMDYPPNVIIRMVQFGLQQQVLESRAIWICVNCHTCSSQCPNNIDLAAVMNTLTTMALEQGVRVGIPSILDFHLEVLRSLETYGRTHKLRIMLRHKLITGNWFSDVEVGLRMLAKGKLDLFPSRVKAMKEIHRFFAPFWKTAKP